MADESTPPPPCTPQRACSPPPGPKRRRIARSLNLPSEEYYEFLFASVRRHLRVMIKAQAEIEAQLDLTHKMRCRIIRSYRCYSWHNKRQIVTVCSIREEQCNAVDDAAKPSDFLRISG